MAVNKKQRVDAFSEQTPHRCPKLEVYKHKTIADISTKLSLAGNKIELADTRLRATYPNIYDLEEM